MPVSLEIKKWPHPDLRRLSFAIPSSVIETREIQDLIDSMMAHVDMYRYRIGGLAANQVGYPYRIAVINLGHRLQEIINPEYVDLSEERSWDIEGCLSFLPVGILGFQLGEARR